MADHLPECANYSIYSVCICDALRACEARSEKAFYQLRADNAKGWDKFARAQFDEGYEKAIKEAKHLLDSHLGYEGFRLLEGMSNE